MSNAPSRNPAGNDTLSGLLNFALLKFLQSVDSCLPAVVIAYNAATNRAQVRPQIVQVTTGNDQVPRGQVASVPVARWGAVGFLIYFPVAPGDKGWLIANDRDISIYKQTGGQSAPNTHRLHSFEDGWFLPDSALDAATLADAGKCCIQSYDGTTAITLGGGTIDIVTPTAVNVTTPQATFDGNVTITGNLTVDNIETLGGISFNTHVHGGVQGGPDNTGVPIA